MGVLLALAFLSSMIAIASGSNLGFTGGRCNHAGLVRRPLATGILGGAIPGKEPHLLEFHGTNCEHCEVSTEETPLKTMWSVLCHVDNLGNDNDTSCHGGHI